MSTTNPLQSHFRQPALYIKLPSEGRFWPDGAIEIGASGEIAVYPMTARDEIMLKTPDALMNGESTVQVIQSCVPAIKNAWAVPTLDLDSILIAIRIASYGEELEIRSVCPECKESNEYEFDLRSIGEIDRKVNWDQPIETDDLKIYLKPQDFFTYNQANMETFEEQKLILLANQEGVSEEDKLRRFTEIFQKLTNLGINNIVKGIERIIINDLETVTNEQFIREFVENTDRKIYDLLSTRIKEIKETVSTKPLSITCGSCSHNYQTPFNLEESNFFG